MHRSKRYTTIRQKVSAKKTYTPADAIKLVKETATTTFDSSIEVHVRLDIDPKKSEQHVRGSIVLPHGIGKSKKIAAFVGPDKAKQAQEAGADIIGGEELIDQIKTSGKIEFELAVATPDMMPKLAAIAKVLGPRGLMPSPKNETITTDLGKTIGELKKGKITFKNDDTGNVHQIIGKASMSEQQLIENFTAFTNSLKKARPATAKGTFIKGISISSTMGPGINVGL